MNESIEQEMNTMCNLGQGLIEQGKAEGRIEGKLEEKNRIFSLIRCLIENGEMDKVARLSEDEQLLNELYKQYHIDEMIHS